MSSHNTEPIDLSNITVDFAALSNHLSVTSGKYKYNKKGEVTGYDLNFKNINTNKTLSAFLKITQADGTTVSLRRPQISSLGQSQSIIPSVPHRTLGCTPAAKLKRLQPRVHPTGHSATIAKANALMVVRKPTRPEMVSGKDRRPSKRPPAKSPVRQLIETQPQLVMNDTQGEATAINSGGLLIYAHRDEVPQIQNEVPQIQNEVPQILNEVPQILNEVPQLLNEVPQVQEPSVSESLQIQIPVAHVYTPALVPNNSSQYRSQSSIPVITTPRRVLLPTPTYPPISRPMSVNYVYGRHYLLEANGPTSGPHTH